jgi:DNA-binding NarL/FixJ family response regulator
LPAIRAGAQGYLLKDIGPNELIQAVREANQGKTQLHPEIAQKLMAMVARTAPPAENASPSQPDQNPAGEGSSEPGE